LPHWKAGHLLTIDYGGAADEIYHRKPAGTIRGYYHHEHVTGTNLYQLPGRQNLTADVNFDDLARWGEELGLHDHRLVTQRKYCSPFLGKSSSLAERFLTNLHGAGQAFKVLVQERG
ncbi:MAG: SAM-dependent methyltransferase, partial [Roseibacillus sp.]|nr:SAM-dependent methyltransferase [Roseibacillus sp.]